MLCLVWSTLCFDPNTSRMAQAQTTLANSRKSRRRFKRRKAESMEVAAQAGYSSGGGGALGVTSGAGAPAMLPVRSTARMQSPSGAAWGPACQRVQRGPVGTPCMRAVLECGSHAHKQGFACKYLHGQRETAPHVRAGTASEGDAGQAGKGNSGDGVRYIYLNFEQLPGLNLATAPALFQYLSSA